MQRCEVCLKDRYRHDFHRGARMCVLCEALQTIAVRSAYDVPLIRPGEVALAEIIRRIEAEQAEIQDSGPGPTDRYFPGIPCDHCGKPNTPPYRSSCARGYRKGLCQGIRAGHLHAFCPCGFEKLLRE